jgi:signal transduction histidine kinase
MAIVEHERFLEILVHDLRSPMNVLKLSLHMISEAAGPAREALAEDLAMMGHNLAELERMLQVLVDYAQLPESREGVQLVPFDPSRMLRDVVDVYAEQHSNPLLTLELRDAPPEVHLPPELVRVAVVRALENAAAAANGISGRDEPHPIRVVLRGAPDRCRVEVVVEGRPRDSVEPTVLRSNAYRRILGTAGERRGLDLATSARVSELLGGSARLEVEPTRSLVVLDWPAKPGRRG